MPNAHDTADSGKRQPRCASQLCWRLFHPHLWLAIAFGYSMAFAIEIMVRNLAVHVVLGTAACFIAAACAYRLALHPEDRLRMRPN